MFPGVRKGTPAAIGGLRRCDRLSDRLARDAPLTIPPAPANSRDNAMFETIKKARQLAAIALERVDDYLALLKVSAEIQGQYFMRRVIGALVVALFAILSLIFLGAAIIV